MAVQFVHYRGREPTFVKHTFLDKYLPALIARVGSQFDTFVYVDGFAGPWKSVAGDSFADTSFGIALRHMTALKADFMGRGRNVAMKALLVEKRADTFQSLRTAIEAFPEIECLPLQGEMEDQIPTIMAGIPKRAFSFALIDPKGFPDLSRIMPLIERPHSEALVNFMFDFANRFAGTTLIPALERWLSSEGKGDWRQEVDRLQGQWREDLLEHLAVEKLRAEAGYPYAPVISVDKALHNRTLYKLIFLTRHAKGLQVFRDSERAALQAQAMSRGTTKAGARQAKSGMADIFGGGVDVQHDRSLRLIGDGQDDAERKVMSALRLAGPSGLKWASLWPSVLGTTVVTYSALGRIVNCLRKNRVIDAPGWPSENHKIPKNEQVLRLG